MYFLRLVFAERISWPTHTYTIITKILKQQNTLLSSLISVIFHKVFINFSKCHNVREIKVIWLEIKIPRPVTYILTGWIINTLYSLQSGLTCTSSPSLIQKSFCSTGKEKRLNKHFGKQFDLRRLIVNTFNKWRYTASHASFSTLLT